ncbi:MAG: amidohydrolase family protein [Acidobacteriota bacterium]
MAASHLQGAEAFGAPAVPSKGAVKNARDVIFGKVFSTPFIDTHEHLIEENGRLAGTTHPRVSADDWSMLLSHYINSDLRTAGMTNPERDSFFSPAIDPVDKWKILEPYWLPVKNTGYGQASLIAIRELYGVEDLSAATVRSVQEGYERVRKPGFYKHILNDVAGIESCQVNSLEGTPFMKTSMPTLLMQDLSIVDMFASSNFEKLSAPAGIEVNSLQDWHRVIDWWFTTYGPYAVAVKSQNAYSRDIDYAETPAEKAVEPFARLLNKEDLSPGEKKTVEDHLFWYAVEKATSSSLPVKLHTGYYAGDNNMRLSRLINNAGSSCDLCRNAPDTRFVFMHICYPYYEEILSVAKHYTNACIDMCWSWIINPVAAKDFLKKYLVTAPANKILTFGADYIPVEPVAGHAKIARRGIALALSELVEEGWMSADNALELVDPVMHGNARRIFSLDEKEKVLKKVSW